MSYLLHITSKAIIIGQKVNLLHCGKNDQCLTSAKAIIIGTLIPILSNWPITCRNRKNLKVWHKYELPPQFWNWICEWIFIPSFVHTHSLYLPKLYKMNPVCLYVWKFVHLFYLFILQETTYWYLVFIIAANDLKPNDGTSLPSWISRWPL